MNLAMVSYYIKSMSKRDTNITLYAVIIITLFDLFDVIHMAAHCSIPVEFRV